MFRTSFLLGLAVALSGCPERPGVKKDNEANSRADKAAKPADKAAKAADKAAKPADKAAKAADKAAKP